MKIVFTGRGTSGSWQIRGIQMAEALKADAVRMASADDLRKYDVIVAVKRIDATLLQSLRRSGRPWVWDMVDPYPQPGCSGWTRDQSIRWVKNQIRDLAPAAVIYPNAKMRYDVGTYGPVIYHHYRPGIAANPIRERIRVIGYEGGRAYLDHWGRAFTRAAEAIGARFDDQIRQLSDCDVVIACRGGVHDSYPCRHWKSNVKLANAHGSGTPFIGQLDDGYAETATGLEEWIETEDDIRRALAALSDQPHRRKVAERFRASSRTVQTTAEELRAVLAKLS